MSLHLRPLPAQPTHATAPSQEPWYPMPCPFCGDQEFVVIEVFYGDTYRPRTAYATCKNGHRSAAFQWNAASTASLIAAKKAAQNDWNTRT